MMSIINDSKSSVSPSAVSASVPVIYNPEIMWQIRIESINRAERWMKVSLYWHRHLRHVSSSPMKLYLWCIGLLHRHYDEAIYYQYIGLLHRSATTSQCDEVDEGDEGDKVFSYTQICQHKKSCQKLSFPNSQY